MIGLRGFHLSLGAGGLRADVGVVELQQQLSLAHVVAFLYQQAFHRGRDGSMRLKVLDGLNLAVGGDQAADRTALHDRDAHFQRSLVKIGIQHRQTGQQVRMRARSTVRRDGVFELFVDANRSSFRLRQE